METRRNAQRRTLMTRLESHMRSATHDGVSETQSTTTSGTPDVESLDILEVLFLLCKSEGMVVAGHPSRAFAHFDSGSGTLYVYARNIKAVEIASDPTSAMLAALDCAQKEGASFTTSNGTAVCVLKDITAHGYTYGEAAVRALAKMQLHAELNLPTQKAGYG